MVQTGERLASTAAESQGREIDKRSVTWFKLDVRNYLDWAEVESENLGYSMDSIRVYLGVYGEKQGEYNYDFSTMFTAPKGRKFISEASTLPFLTGMRGSKVPPLNDGTGGGSSYPE